MTIRFACAALASTLSSSLLRALPIFLLLLPNAAEACIDIAPFEIEDLRQADAVFSGRLVRYEIVSPGRSNTLDEYGLVTVQVDQVFKGKASGQVQLYWWNSTFGMPEELLVTEPALFAAVRSDSEGLPLRGPSATIFPSRRPDLMRVLQAPCSGKFILPYSKNDANDVRAILNGGSVEGAEGFPAVDDVNFQTVSAIHIGEPAAIKTAMLIAAAFLTLAVAVVLFWRRKRQRGGVEIRD